MACARPHAARPTPRDVIESLGTQVAGLREVLAEPELV